MPEHPTELELRQWGEGSLPAAESTWIEEHLESCDQCASSPALTGQLTDEFADRVRDLFKRDDSAAQSDRLPTTVRHGIERVGETIGPYKLLQRLGEGGMGTVWMAQQDRPVKRVVALKIIKAGMDTKEVIARFETERQALAMMDHPNIAKVLDADATDSGRPYFVMEMVKGVPITDYCDQNRMSAEQRLELFCDICRAVQHAHRKGVIHRDLKPTNVLVKIDDRTPLVKIIDFGLAKATGAKLTERTLFTALGQMVGTPAYMSPEQAEMSGLDVDTRTDVYSLGVLLYELLTGATPVDVARLQKAGYAEIQRIIRDEDPPCPSTRLSSLNGDSSTVAQRRSTEPKNLVQLLRGDVDVIVMKALEKDRGRRYDSPGELADDVQRYLNHEPIEARPASIAYRLKRLYQRNRVAVAAATVVIASLLMGTIVSTSLAIRAMRAESLAQGRLVDVRNEQIKTNEALKTVQAEKNRAVGAEKLAEQRRVAVKAEQQKTQDALDASELSREEAEAITKLLVDVFRSPDPKRDGANITVAEMLDHSVERLDRFSGQPRRQARLKKELADTYHSLALFEKELPLREELNQYWSGEVGEEDSDAIFAQLNLGNVYSSVGRKKDANDINTQLLALVTRLRGPRAPLTLTITNNLANNLSDRAEQLALREKNVELAIQVLGPESPPTLRYMDNLSISYFGGNRHDEALKLREEVLRLRRKILGPEHPDTLFTIRGLLLYYRREGDTEKELPLAEENLRISSKVLGPKHPYTITSMGRIAGALEQVGRTDESLRLREQVLELKKEVFGSTSKQANYTTGVLVVRYGVHGECENAMRLGRTLVETSSQASGVEAKETIAAMNTTAFALCVRPDVEPAAIEVAQEYATKIVELTPEKATYWNTLAIVSYRQGKWKEALQALDKSIELNRKGGDAADRYFIAMTNWQLGEKDEARRLLDEANRWLEQHPSKDLWPSLFRQEANGLIDNASTEDSNTN